MSKPLPTNATVTIEYRVRNVNAYTSNLITNNTVAFPAETSTIKSVLLQPHTSINVGNIDKSFILTSWSPVTLLVTANAVSTELECNGVFVYTGKLDDVIISNPTEDIINMQYVAC